MQPTCTYINVGTYLGKYRTYIAMEATIGAEIFDQACSAATFIQQLLPEKLRNPFTGIICGSGLGKLADGVAHAPRLEVDYERIPYFPQSTGTS